MMTSTRENPLEGQDAAELCRLGAEALKGKNYAAAHRHLQGALDQERLPDHLSLFALAQAHHTGEIQTGISLCQEAIKKDPKNPEHFLRLGTIYLIGGKRKEAIRIFQLGLRVGRHPEITKLLQALGLRKRPVLPFLARTNPLNKYLGKIMMKFSRNR